MKAGDLNRLLYHFRRRPGLNDQGESDPAFDPVGLPHAVGMLPADVKRGGTEVFAVGHITRTIDRHFTLRFDGVLAGDRVQVSGVMYDVIHVLNIGTEGFVGYQLKCSFSE